MKDFDWYSGKDLDRKRLVGEKPKKPVFKEKDNATVAALDEFRKSLVEYENAMNRWIPAQETYQNAVNERAACFGIDLRNEYFDSSWMTQQTWDKLYDKAYDDGHAYGYSEVVSKLEDLIEFVNDLRPTFVKS